MAAIGEDSSRQDMKKKHAVGKVRRRGGHEVPRGFEARPLESESSEPLHHRTSDGSGASAWEVQRANRRKLKKGNNT